MAGRRSKYGTGVGHSLFRLNSLWTLSHLCRCTLKWTTQYVENATPTRYLEPTEKPF